MGEDEDGDEDEDEDEEDKYDANGDDCIRDDGSDSSDGDLDYECARKEDQGHRHFHDLIHGHDYEDDYDDEAFVIELFTLRELLHQWMLHHRLGTTITTMKPSL